MKHGQRISSIQFVAMIIMQTMVFGMLLFPRSLAKMANHAALYGMIALGLLAFVSIWLLNWLALTFPDQTAGEFFFTVFGRIIGFPMVILTIVTHLVWLAIQVRILADLFSTVVLRETPPLVLQFVMLLAAVYVAFNGIEALGRYCGLVFLPSLVIIGLMFVLGWGDLNLAFLKPFSSVGTNTALSVTKGVLANYYLFMGIQIVAGIFAFTDGKKRTARQSYLAVALLVTLFSLVFVTVIGVLGIEGTRIINWPGVFVIRLVQFPGIFIERFGLFVLALWTLAGISSNALILWGISTFSAPLLGIDLAKGRYLLLPLAVSTYWISNLPNQFDLLDDLMLPVISVIGMWTNIALPIIMISIAKIRGLGTNKQKRKGG